MVCTFSFQLIKNIIRFSSFFSVSFIFLTFLFSNNERPRERMHITPSGIEDFASSRRRIDNLSVWTMFQLFHSTLLESDRAARGRSFFLYTFSTRPREKEENNRLDVDASRRSWKHNGEVPPPAAWSDFHFSHGDFHGIKNDNLFINPMMVIDNFHLMLLYY